MAGRWRSRHQVALVADHVLPRELACAYRGRSVDRDERSELGDRRQALAQPSAGVVRFAPDAPSPRCAI
ncbi:MAG: hypothetical protein ABSG43_28425, partial [Solirubrobacteraceae bacterium]